MRTQPLAKNADQLRLLAYRDELSGLGVIRCGRKAWRCICADNYVTVGGWNNPNYRPDCPSPDIAPGDYHFEYLGETAGYQSGTRYCAGCAVTVWIDG